MRPQSGPKWDLSPQSEEFPRSTAWKAAMLATILPMHQMLEPNAPGNKLIQKDSMDCGMQFITPTGPRQVDLFSQGS